MEYRVLRCSTHERLETEINELGRSGWYPIAYSVWPRGDGFSAEHFCILGRLG
jgi:hypothetical protein